MGHISAIIIDDEWKARENLRAMINRHSPEVEILALCSSPDEARNAILKYEPELIFLDIKMPEETGFEFIQSIRKKRFKIIFTTAHANYALEAFEEGAIDYLLKPIHSSRLIRAIERYKAWNALASSTITASPSKHDRITIPTDNGFELIEAKRIIRFEAKRSKTIAYLMDNDSIIIPRNLKKVEVLLSGDSFIRVHHSHIVNVDHIQRIVKVDGGFVFLKDGTRIEISRRKKMEILSKLGALKI